LLVFAETGETIDKAVKVMIPGEGRDKHLYFFTKLRQNFQIFDIIYYIDQNKITLVKINFDVDIRIQICYGHG
jgi:hypothetical protein